MPMLAIHAPCLLLTQRVWSTDPWTKLVRAREAAERVGAPTVVVHPPFRWQREYARGFVEGWRGCRARPTSRFAVENMFPWRARSREVVAYLPHWDLLELDVPAVTLDLSHTAVSDSDAVAGARRARRPALPRPPRRRLGLEQGRAPRARPGRQPCADVLERLARTGFDGSVVLEVNTRRALNRDEREADLAEGLAFARLNLAAAAGTRGDA